MYAKYQAAPPARELARATAVSSDQDYEGQTSTIREHISAPMFVYCFVGTFGLLLPTYLQASNATSNWEINQIDLDGFRTAVEPSVSPTAKDIAHIRQATNISVSELARACGVSRQAVHEWIKGNPLSKTNAQRISKLAQAVDVLLASGTNALPQTLRRKVSGGMSILEAVQTDGNVVDLAQQLVSTLARESEQRKKLSERLAGRRKPQLSSIEFGAPHLDDNI